MRKIVLASFLYFVGDGSLVGSQASVAVSSKQDQVVNPIEKMETDKWVRYSLSNQSQEVFVYKVFKEMGKTVSFMINAIVPGISRRAILVKFKDNAFVSLQKRYEQQEQNTASSC